jgi:CRP-like cAMP-binding protein
MSALDPRTEEQRAADYRASLARRRAAERARAAALAGSASAAQEVRAAWQPVIDYLAGRAEYAEDADHQGDCP